MLDFDVEVLPARALAGGMRAFVVGVYNAEVVSAFEPAADDPEDANEEAAPAPVVPDDAFD